MSSSKSNSSPRRQRSSSSSGSEHHSHYSDEQSDHHSEHSDNHSDHHSEHHSDEQSNHHSYTRRYTAAKPNVVLCFRCGEMGHDVDQCLRFKVKLCKYFMEGWCERDDERVPCPFAHGEAELRRPWVKKCVRVWSELRGDACIGGCGKLGHTYTECPLNRDSE